MFPVTNLYMYICLKNEFNIMSTYYVYKQLQSILPMLVYKNMTYDTEGKAPVLITKHQTMFKRVPAISASNTMRSEQSKSCYSYFNHVE